MTYNMRKWADTKRQGRQSNLKTDKFSLETHEFGMDCRLCTGKEAIIILPKDMGSHLTEETQNQFEY